MSPPAPARAEEANPSLPGPNARETAAALIATADTAALATFSPNGARCGSLISVERDGDLDLYFSLGSGCTHIENLGRDPRATVLLTQRRAAGERASKVAISGRAEPAGRDALGNSVYRLAPERVKVTVADSAFCVCLDRARPEQPVDG